VNHGPTNIHRLLCNSENCRPAAPSSFYSSEVLVGVEPIKLRMLMNILVSLYLLVIKDLVFYSLQYDERNSSSMRPMLNHCTQVLTMGTKSTSLSILALLLLLLLALSSKATLCLTNAIFCSILLLADWEPGGLPLFLCRATNQSRWANWDEIIYNCELKFDASLVSKEQRCGSECSISRRIKE